MKHLSNKACCRIYQILLESRTRCNRSVIEVCVFANFDTRNPYYNVINGRSLDPIIYIKIGVGANIPVELFAEYLEAANIVLSPRLSDENRLFWKYLEDHSSSSGTNYDIEDLNDYLSSNGCDRL